MGTEWLEGPALGIDLGTNYSCVGVWRNGHVEIIANDQGNRTTPSCVAFTDCESLVGEAALDQSSRNIAYTIFGSKRLIGRKYCDINPGCLPYKVIAGSEGQPLIVVQHRGEEKFFLPEHISATILSHMKEISETFMGTTVTKAVITVPAYFRDSQRWATKEAARFAKLDVMRIINEPIAAAVTYQFEGPHSDDATSRTRTLLVFDLGGGTFDVAIVKACGSQVTVKATAGDPFLGGDDFTERMVSYLEDIIQEKYEVELSVEKKQRLRAACERAKRILSSYNEAVIELCGLHFQWTFTRAKFEEINMELFQRCMGCVRICMNDAYLDASKIDEVVLVGGSSRIPKVQQMLRELCKGKQPCKFINPDEAVAYGATVLSTSLVGGGDQRVKDLKLVDVTPLSLGISIRESNQMHVMIPRNSPTPVKETQCFQPIYDNATSVVFDIYEGERAMTADNNLIGSLVLDGLPADKRCYEVSIDVVFEIDADGIFFASAKHLASGASTKATLIDRRSLLPSGESSRMVHEAIYHRFEDKKRAEMANSKSELQEFLKNAETRWEDLDRRTRTELETMNAWMEENDNAEPTAYQERLKEVKDKCPHL